MGPQPTPKAFTKTKSADPKDAPSYLYQGPKLSHPNLKWRAANFFGGIDTNSGTHVFTTLSFVRAQALKP
jgi:hypothetical protein